MTIIGVLKKLSYKVNFNNEYYYLIIIKCYKGYIVRYWNFNTKEIVKQSHNTLLGALIKTKEAIDILIELKEIK